MAQRNETANLLYESCLQDAGQNVHVAIDGSVSRTFDHELSDMENRAIIKAESECAEQTSARIGSVPRFSDDQIYQFVRDTAECLHYHGHPEIGEPPSQETWIDQYRTNPQGRWSPYGELDRQNPDITEGEWYRLKGTCVEGGVVFMKNFTPDPRTSAGGGQ